MGLQAPNFDESGMGDDDDDGDLEAELQRLQQGTGGGYGSKANKRKAGLWFEIITCYSGIMKYILYIYRWSRTRSSSIA